MDTEGKAMNGEMNNRAISTLMRAVSHSAAAAFNGTPQQAPISAAVNMAAKRKVRVLFLIRALTLGGAQRQLMELAKALDKAHFEIGVAVFYNDGALRPEMDAIPGIHVYYLGKKGRWDWISCFWRMRRVMKEFKPQIVHGYMGTSNEFALMMARLYNARAVWGLRQASQDFSDYDPLCGCIFRMGAWVSGFADLIIVNSEAGKRAYLESGYAGGRMIVIQNGIDTIRFHPDFEAGQRVRAEWTVCEGCFLIGMVARIDPMKDHPTFLRAAAALVKRRADIRFVCVGGCSKELQALSSSLGLGPFITWEPGRSDVCSVYNALDVLTSTSLNEGFSNAIGEAMACGVPCIITDVGDSALIVDSSERVFAPGDFEALVRAWEHFMDKPASARRKVSEECRRRIVDNFSVDRLVSKTESALLSVV